MNRIESPDLGHPLQHFDEARPVDFVLTPAERDAAKIASIELERQRRAANKLDEDAEIARLGVVWMDGGDAA